MKQPELIPNLPTIGKTFSLYRIVARKAWKKPLLTLRH
jgi:hypothetical protein